jgi:pyrroloquinoline quinone (PQQ) biosynthesis protein C
MGYLDTVEWLMYSQVQVSDGLAFVRALEKEAREHRAVHHPYLHQLVSADVPDIQWALTDFVFQYSAYSFDFVRYLTATIAQMTHDPHRKALLQNLVEESGKIDAENVALLASMGIEPAWVDGVPHTELFLRYLNAAGVDAAYRRRNPYSEAAIHWRDQFFSLCFRKGPAQALGAMGLGTENIVKYIYQQLIQAMERHLDIALRDRVFFDLHATIDDQHGDTLLNITLDYAASEDQREQIREGMLAALNLRAAFFDALQARAMAIKPV